MAVAVLTSKTKKIGRRSLRKCAINGDLAILENTTKNENKDAFEPVFIQVFKSVSRKRNAHICKNTLQHLIFVFRA